MTEYVKLEFRIEDEDGGFDIETPWAVPLGGDLYELANIPFSAYRVSESDIVQATKDTDDGFPVFRKIVKKSGNKTVRIIFEPPVEDGNISDQILNQLVKIGCSYEGATKTYIGITIPPQIDLFEIRDFLEQHKLQWEHADPTYEDIYFASNGNIQPQP